MRLKVNCTKTILFALNLIKMLPDLCHLGAYGSESMEDKKDDARKGDLKTKDLLRLD